MRRLIPWFVIALLLSTLRTTGPVIEAQDGTTRRVNIPYFPEEANWAQTAVFWFGENQQGVPSENYVDVRMAYTAEALMVHATVVDYYLWYRLNATTSDDLGQYDAVAVYLDTHLDRAAAPQTDDYVFLIGAHHWPNEDAAEYRRQARGTGTGWNTTWIASWSDYEAMQWSCNPGPNSNECGIDYGWIAVFSIPWEVLGQAGPPTAGTVWGLGVQLFDRDDEPPAGYVAPEHWPESLDEDSPATWGQLHFGYADYQPPTASPRGTTTIRASSTTDNTVEDAWMGGGGTCSSGHEGGTEINHGDDTGLFVGTETAPTHFPCFNKSYLRFSLDAIPPGQSIISATLTLHLWGNAGETPDLAEPSWVHLFTITDPWEEMAIHWNNAPLPRQNVSATWVYPYSGDRSDPHWPGDPYTWDATQAVAEAYAERRAVSLALYGSDTDQHSSKYLTSSESGDWNEAGRPTLTVVWGQGTQAAQLAKSARTRPPAPGTALAHGGTITYHLQIVGSGEALTVTDVLPAGISHPVAYSASAGSVTYDALARTLTWTGAPGTGQEVGVTYPVTVTQIGTFKITNVAHLTAAGGGGVTASTTVLVGANQVFLPCMLRRDF